MNVSTELDRIRERIMSQQHTDCRKELADLIDVLQEMRYEIEKLSQNQMYPSPYQPHTHGQ